MLKITDLRLALVSAALAVLLAACSDNSPAAPDEPPEVPDVPAPDETGSSTATDEEDIPAAFAEVELPDNPTAEGLHDTGDVGEDLYRRGLYREALEYWEVAAEDEGDAYAAYRLGVEYFDAQVFERDIPTAVRYQQLATELGSAAGMFELAGFYEAGIGVRPDVERAAQLYLQSAMRGFPPAQHNVATMFEDGAGVVQDPVRAYMFYHFAIEQGFRVNFEPRGEDGAAVFVDPRRRLEASFTDEQRALAQDLIENFEPIE